MPHFAPVCPIHIAEAFQTYGILGDYHLLLAHDVIKHPDEYRKVFGERKWDGTVILDNSVVELKTAVSLDDVLAAAEIVRPTVVVLPDAYENQEATILACDEARKSWKYPLDKLLGMGKWTFMYVPQGLTLPTLIYCAQQFADDPYIGWWGVARNIANNIGTRRDAIQLMFQLQPKRRIHMLGFSHNVLDDIMCATIFQNLVDGIDSAVPIRCASLGLPFTPVFRDPLPARGDWWDAPETVYVDLMSRNLATIRALINPRDCTYMASRDDGYTINFNDGRTTIRS